jgi:RHS repeat-associated protein
VFRLGYIYGTAHNVNGQDHEITPAHNNGNIARIKYFISGALQHSQTFQYDPLNRLGNAVEHNNGVYNDTSRAWYQTFAYDPYGNRGINVENTSDNVDAANRALQLADFSAANNRITRDGFAYDAVGNLTAEPGKSYTYDAENRIVTATVAGGAMSQYFYDGNGRRVKKVVGGVATRFEYGAGGELVAERNESNGSLKNDYFYWGGQLLASTKTGTTYEYATADHLGSPRAWTDHSGNLVAGGRHDYLPYGEELFAGVGARAADQGYASNTQQDGNRKQFTGYERDPETELDFAQARYFSSVQGRFTSVDPLLASGRPINPQSWNRYSYALNRPLILSDPSGMWSSDNGTNGTDIEQTQRQQLPSIQLPILPLTPATAPPTSMPALPTPAPDAPPHPDLRAGIERARELLRLNPDASISPQRTGPDSPVLLRMLDILVANALITVGTTYIDNQGTTRTFGPGTGAVTAGLASYPNENGTLVSTRRIQVNRNGFYFTGRTPGGAFHLADGTNTGFQGVRNLVDIQAISILHEVGHVTGRLPSDGFTSSSIFSIQNTKRVREAYLPSPIPLTTQRIVGGVSRPR